MEQRARHADPAKPGPPHCGDERRLQGSGTLARAGRAAEDEIVRKYRFSAFLPGTCELPYRLRARGFDTVLITGTVTNVCCESSARDAMMTNFKTIMVSDANAAMTMEEHNASLAAFYAIFGDVMDADFVIQRLTRNEPTSAAR